MWTLCGGTPEPEVAELCCYSCASGGVVPPTPTVTKDVVMGEFNKDQGQGNQSGQQGDKPAFGQFDKEQGQGGQSGQGEQGQQDMGKGQQEELAGADKAQQSEQGMSGGQGGLGGQSGQQEQGQQFGQKGEDIQDGGQQGDQGSGMGKGGSDQSR
jgi:Ca-activated chloride channel family protein